MCVCASACLTLGSPHRGASGQSATPQGDGMAGPGLLLGGDEALGVSGARLGTVRQPGQGFARRH